MLFLLLDAFRKVMLLFCFNISLLCFRKLQNHFLQCRMTIKYVHSFMLKLWLSLLTCCLVLTCFLSISVIVIYKPAFSSSICHISVPGLSPSFCSTFISLLSSSLSAPAFCFLAFGPSTHQSWQYSDVWSKTNSKFHFFCHHLTWKISDLMSTSDLQCTVSLEL